MPEPEYGQRYCAFIDILGFSALIEKLDVAPRPLAFYGTCYRKFTIRRPPKEPRRRARISEPGAFRMPLRCRRRLSPQVWAPSFIR
jgi:hypothetical protein